MLSSVVSYGHRAMSFDKPLVIQNRDIVAHAIGAVPPARSHFTRLNLCFSALSVMQNREAIEDVHLLAGTCIWTATCLLANDTCFDT